MIKTSVSKKGKPFCEKLSDMLYDLPNNDERKVVGIQILQMLLNKRINLSADEFAYLESLENPLDYLIEISDYEGTFDIAQKNIAYNIRRGLRNAVKSFSE